MTKRSLATVLAILLAHSSLSWGGQILETVSKLPSNMSTPLGPMTKQVQKFTGIACFDVRNGMLQDCGFDMTVIGLTPPPSDVANNGGHTHDVDTHRLGKLSIIAPIIAGPSTSLAGQTAFDVFIISHAIPDVSGKIDTLLNLRVPTVPPGWHTVSPESCDATQTSWCFLTTVDVGVSGLTSLPGASFSPPCPVSQPGGSYKKCRNSDSAHTNAVAFSGTSDALLYLNAMADNYILMTGIPLSINDMSLFKGGLFDWKANPLSKEFDPAKIYLTPHSFHRTGQSADINRDNGNCIQNKSLLAVVNDVMPPIPGSPFAINRTLNSQGRFLCEELGLKPTNNIHIDFDVQAPPSPSAFQ